MTIEQARAKTAESNEKLELAKELAMKAASLPEGSEERARLEARAQELVDDARELTETAKEEIKKYK